jgi:hypothetical protein
VEEDCNQTTGIKSFYEYPTFVNQSFGIDFGYEDDDNDDLVSSSNDDDVAKSSNNNDDFDERLKDKVSVKNFESGDRHLSRDKSLSNSEEIVKNRQTPRPLQKSPSPTPTLSKQVSRGKTQGSKVWEDTHKTFCVNIADFLNDL